MQAGQVKLEKSERLAQGWPQTEWHSNFEKEKNRKVMKKPTGHRVEGE